MRVAPEIGLTEDECVKPTKLSQSRLSSVRLAQRAQIVLLAADGIQNQEIAEELGIGRILVARWRATTEAGFSIHPDLHQHSWISFLGALADGLKRRLRQCA